MAEHPTPSAGGIVAVHLLDATQGHTLQTWRFVGHDAITIGRSDDNDIAIGDPHVSRLHAKLLFDGSGWKLISTGRHGTLINDRLVTEFAMRNRTTFRLGAAGPTLRFDTCAPETQRSETIDNIESSVFAMLEIDEHKKQQEVEQITANAMFRDLLEQARRVRAADALQSGNR